MRTVFIVFIAIHGCLHFVATRNASELPLHTHAFWAIIGLLFIISAALLLVRKDPWWFVAATAVVISQFLIVNHWEYAKFGTMANFVITMIVIINASTWRFHQAYVEQIKSALNSPDIKTMEYLTESDLSSLPEAVRRYVRYSGAVGKPKVINFKIELCGRIRSKKKNTWIPFTSQQYNFVKPPKRLFFMKAFMKGLPVAGYHSYNESSAFMDIRLLSILPIQYQKGKEMNLAETVTFFNDLCIFAPGGLIDKRIHWIDGDNRHVNATFTNKDIMISAALEFNDEGQLVNFISNDRYVWESPGKMTPLTWSTPISGYQLMNGIRIAHLANALYEYPDGSFCYAQFELKRIDYNLTN